MNKTIFQALLVFFLAGGVVALFKEESLIGLGMLGFAAFVLPTVSALLWMRKNKKNGGKK